MAKVCATLVVEAPPAPYITGVSVIPSTASAGATATWRVEIYNPSSVTVGKTLKVTIDSTVLFNDVVALLPGSNVANRDFIPMTAGTFNVCAELI